MIITEAISVSMQLIALALVLAVGGAGGVGGAGNVGGTGGAGPAERWWSNAVYYRIQVDSFKDINGDGLGDLQGVTKQMSYVRALGADAIILSAISARSSDCTCPGVTNFAEIDDRYGDLNTFKSLIEKTHRLELKVVITLKLEAISVASEWYKLSVARNTGYEDIILWKEAKPDAPVSWNGLNWTWSEDRGAHYAATDNGVLLDLCAENTALALSTALCVWLKRGISGVLLNVNRDSECTGKLVKGLAADARSCARSANLETPVIIVEIEASPADGALYDYEGNGANSVISNVLTSPTRPTGPDLAVAVLTDMFRSPQDMAATWQTSITGGTRIATRYGSEMVDAVNLLALILPGAAIIQQGDELGAADTLQEWVSTADCWPAKGEPSLAPFPWDDTPGAGFTSGQPWLPLATNYRYANAKTEFANELSHVGVVRVAAAMRKSLAMGPHTEIRRLGHALSVLRWGGSGSLLVVVNFGRSPLDVELTNVPGLPPTMTVAASSGGSSLSTGGHVTIDKSLRLGPGDAVLLAGPARHCGGPGPVDKIANKLSEGWQKINKYFSNI